MQRFISVKILKCFLFLLVVTSLNAQTICEWAEDNADFYPPIGNGPEDLPGLFEMWLSLLDYSGNGYLDVTELVGITNCIEEGEFFAGVQVIFNQSCAFASCHQGPNPSSDLSLEEGVSHANIVLVDSVQSALKRVEPFDLHASYLFKKVLGTDISGSRCPRNMPPLFEYEIVLVKNWILRGAPE